MILNFHGKEWRYIRSKSKYLNGYCQFNRSLIAVSDSLKGEKELEINIHEMLHACSLDFADEEWVKKTAKDIAHALRELGYSKNGDD